jgi:UvrA family protein
VSEASTNVLGGQAERAVGESIVLEVVQDRLRFDSAERSRVIEALEAALNVGRGKANVHVVESLDGPALRTYRFSSDLHCAECDIHYRDPVPSLFSFNSPIGACDSCRGFGRTIGIDFGLVVPDESKTLREGAVRCWQSESYRECQDDLIKFARKRGIPLDVPWRELTPEQRAWVLEGEGSWEEAALVRRAPLLRVARVPILQDAHSRALVEIPRLHRLQGVQRRATQGGRLALPTRNACGCRARPT